MAAMRSMYGARGCLHAGIEFDLTERAFIIGHILVEDRRQRLGLLRAQIDSLKVAHLYLILRLLLHGAEDEKKVPDVHADLHAVGVGFPILGSVHNAEIRLSRIDHHGSQFNGNGAIVKAASSLRPSGLRYQA
jgi:hypothetical protein